MAEAAIVILCPVCAVPLAMEESLSGCVIEVVHARPTFADFVALPGFGAGIMGAQRTIREWARDRHDPLGP